MSVHLGVDTRPVTERDDLHTFLNPPTEIEPVGADFHLMANVLTATANTTV